LAVERAREMGLCFGVRRAIRLLEEAARKFGSLDSLGPVVHNRQVVERLEGMGVRVARGPADLEYRVVAISSHGRGSKMRAPRAAAHHAHQALNCPLNRPP